MLSNLALVEGRLRLVDESNSASLYLGALPFVVDTAVGLVIQCLENALVFSRFLSRRVAMWYFHQCTGTRLVRYEDHHNMVVNVERRGCDLLARKASQHRLQGDTAAYFILRLLPHSLVLWDCGKRHDFAGLVFRVLSM